jgi:hypothetical protein
MLVFGIWQSIMQFTYTMILQTKESVTPSDIFTGSAVPRHRLLDLHVWGCPVYVMDPEMQQVRKPPRWQPRSRRGMNLGLSIQHSSEVPLVLNLTTGSIDTQYHPCCF